MRNERVDIKYKSNVKYVFIVAAFLWICSFFTERLFFNQELLNMHNAPYIILKAMLAVLYFAFCSLIVNAYRNVKKGAESYKFAVRVFFSYLMIMTILLFMVWPGLWRDDEFHVISGCVNFHMNSIQHYLTSCMYIIFLMIFPCAGGMIFCEQIIYSLIVAYIAYHLHEKYNLEKRWCLFCLIPFIFIPVLDSNLYPMRMCMYTFIEIFFLSTIIFHLKVDISRRYCIVYSVVCSLLAVWRSEGFYYILVGTVLFCVLFRKIKLYWKIGVVFMVFILSMIGIKIQDDLAQKQIGDQIFIVSTLDFIYDELVNERIDSAGFRVIDEVIDMSVLREYGVTAVWSDHGLIRKDYTEAEFGNYKIAYAKTVLKDLPIFIHNSFERYLKTNGIGNQNIFLDHTADLYNEEINYEVRKEFKNKTFNMPMYENLRKKLIKVVELENYNGFWADFLRVLMYNTILPTLLLLFSCAILFYKKKVQEGMIFLISLIKFPLIFATAPNVIFMYYYAIYLEGYLSAFIVAGLYLGNGRRKING